MVKFADFKTRFYRFQGWDEKTGYPTRKTLDSIDLAYVADELEKNVNYKTMNNNKTKTSCGPAADVDCSLNGSFYS